MKCNKNKCIHLIFGVLLTALLLALGIALIWSCLDIYKSGQHPYTPDSIAAHFQNISLLVYLTVGMIALGIVLNLVLPVNSDKPKAIRDNKETLSRLETKAGELVGDFAQKIEKERKLRFIVRLCTGLAIAFLCIPPLRHFANQENFIGDKTQCVIHAMTIVLVYGGTSLILSFICKVLCGKSINRQIDICKASIASNGANNNVKPVINTDKEAKRIIAIRCVLAVVAITFIALGIFNGGAEAVLNKANAICMECIGMG